MRQVIKYVFKTNYVPICIVLAVFIAVKMLTVSACLGDIKANKIPDEWLEKCNGLSVEQLEKYMFELKEEVYIENIDKIENYIRFYEQYVNFTTVNQLINFARNGEGILPQQLPDNFVALDSFYEELATPDIIASEKISSYFELQKYSLVFFAIAILTTTVYGAYCESGVRKAVIVTERKRFFEGSLLGFVFAYSFCIFCANELVDICVSGVLADKVLLSATLQSYPKFCFSQSTLTFGEAWLMMMVVKICNLIILVECAILLVQKLKSAKNTATILISIMLIPGIINSFIKDEKWSSVLQWGLIDWENILKHTTIISNLASFWITNTWIGTNIVILTTVVFITLRHHLTKLRCQQKTYTKK